MKNAMLKNERGSILVVVVIIGVIITGLMVTSINGMVALGKQQRHYGIMQENLRIGGALAQIFAGAYELAQSQSTFATTCTTANGFTPFTTTGGTNFCFNTGPTLTNYSGYCVNAQFGQSSGNTSPVCPYIPTTPNGSIGRNEDHGVINFIAQWKVDHHSIFESLFPSAFGATGWGAQQPVAPAWGVGNTFGNTGAACTSFTAPGVPCQVCGASPDNICVHIQFCSADSASLSYPPTGPAAGCTAITQDVMIIR